MFKNIMVCFLSAFLINCHDAEAGIISKVAKGAVIVQGSKIIAKQATKKFIKNGVKDSTKPLLKNELNVGQYGKMIKNREPGLDYHHMPSTKQIEKYGVKKNDGISMGLQHDRHSLTRTYKNGNKPILKNNEAPRDALARDIKDQKKILQDNNLYDQKARNALQEVIKQNKDKFPNLYKKP